MPALSSKLPTITINLFAISNKESDTYNNNINVLNSKLPTIAIINLFTISNKVFNAYNKNINFFKKTI